MTTPSLSSRIRSPIRSSRRCWGDRQKAGSDMSRLMLAFTALGWLMANAAWGQSETAPAPADYPDPQCARPQVQLIKPVNTYSNHIDDSAPVGSYNQKVRLYNGQARDYD